MKKITPTAPVIRFRGFTDVWEQRKLNNVADVRDGTHDSPRYRTEGHPFITSKNIKDGFINYADIQYISDEDFNEINKRSKVEVNDILMGMIGTIGNMALVREKPDYAIKNVALIKDTKKVHYLYLYHFLHSNNVVMQLFSGIDGGTQKFVSLNNIRNLNILFPNLKEQVKLGSFFEKIDYDIALHQRKLEQQKKLKKYFLQNMFPEEGETVSRIRFKGFTGDWEQRKILDIAPLQRGFDLPKANMKFGSYPVVMSNGIEGYHSEYKVKGPGVVTGRSGTIGKVHYVESDFWPHNTTLWVTDFKSNLPKFIYYLYEWLDLSRFGTGSGVPTLNRNDVHDTKVAIPVYGEQKKIADCLDGFDHLITLHQRKIDQLQAMKKFMLQNLFV